MRRSLSADRTDRLLGLIVVLRRASRPLGRAELLAAVSGYGTSNAATLRRFERDKVALRAMGLPLESVRNADGEDLGYRLQNSEQPPFRCVRGDRLVLAAAADSLAGVPGLPLHSVAQNALAKLLEAPVREAVPSRGHDENLVDLLAWLAEAAAVAVSFSYRRDGEEPRPVELDDLLLEGRAAHWYLSGFDRARRADRSFRLDRIDGRVRRIEPGPGRREQAQWSVWHIAAGARTDALLRPDAHASPLPEALLSERLADGSTRVQTSNREALLRFLCSDLGWRVEAPGDLRHEVVERLRDLSAQ
jgi:predicted DNA-binding transcriptional regulator YafY